jgi:hypothetical protein
MSALWENRVVIDLSPDQIMDLPVDQLGLGAGGIRSRLSTRLTIGAPTR